jgi:tRNA (cytidine32/uridine32-2'-O)-methyltransferase
MTDFLRIVLVGTQHPGNIGSAARAMKTMGLSRLCLVAPERFPDPDAYALAAGANDVLDVAEIHPNLATAVADCHLVLASTVRRRTVPMPELNPREGAQRLLAGQALGQVALVFGRERTGLENDELQLCHAAICIPANPEYSSLNLAAAVQVLCYEFRLAMLARVQGSSPAAQGPVHALVDDAGTGAPLLDPDDLPASHGEMESFFAHLGSLLDEIDFHKGKAPDMVTQRLRRLFLRAMPDPRELRILRGIFSDTQRLLRTRTKL